MHNVVATLPFNDNLLAIPPFRSSYLTLRLSSFSLLLSRFHPHVSTICSLTSTRSFFSLQPARRRVYASVYEKEEEKKGNEK